MYKRQVIANQDIDIRFTVQTLVGPNFIPTYQELHSITTDSNGIAIAIIGEGDIIVGSFPANFWLPNISLNTEIDIERDGTFVDFGNMPFQSVPMAVQAKRADIATVALTANNVSTKIDDLSDGKSDLDGSSLFIGKNAGTNDDGTHNSNVGIGFNAFETNTTGNNNTAIGEDAHRFNMTGNFNSAIGSGSLYVSQSGNYNSALGFEALVRLEQGNRNIAIGKGAGGKIIAGNNNIYIGFEAGQINNTVESNKLYINNSETSPPLIYGEFDNELIRINGTFDVTEEINRTSTGNANLVPIAYGSVNGSANPGIVGGTGNFSVTRNSTTNEYTISVTDETLDLTNTVASVVSNTSNFRTVNVTYSGGNMIVHIFIANGDKVASPFQFTIYKR